MQEAERLAYLVIFLAAAACSYSTSAKASARLRCSSGEEAGCLVWVWVMCLYLGSSRDMLGWSQNDSFAGKQTRNEGKELVRGIRSWRKDLCLEIQGARHRSQEGRKCEQMHVSAAQETLSNWQACLQPLADSCLMCQKITVKSQI